MYFVYFRPCHNKSCLHQRENETCVPGTPIDLFEDLTTAFVLAFYILLFESEHGKTSKTSYQPGRQPSLIRVLPVGLMVPKIWD